jgi:4'-phosphopantetheinyl transferase
MAEDRWTPVVEVPRPERGTAHVVRLPLQVPGEIETRLRDLLDPAEAARAARFHHPRDERRFVVARGALRRLLATMEGLEPRTLRLVEGPFGKPALDPALGSELRFNLSHSGELALLAFARGIELGVDLEEERGDVDIEGVGEQVFSAAERTALAALDPAERRRTFFQLWARKEAVIKAEGTGFSEPSAAFTVTPLRMEAPRLLEHLRRPSAVRRWSLCDLDAAPGYGAALAMEARGVALHLWHGGTWETRGRVSPTFQW